MNRLDAIHEECYIHDSTIQQDGSRQTPMYAMLLTQDPDERAVLLLVLQRTGLAVTSASDVERAMRSWLERPADLILLALEGEPLAQVRRVRAETEAPLVVIPHRIDEATHCGLLQAGADLVIPRPFSARLLISQLQALMRRSGSIPLFSLPSLRLSNLTLDVSDRTVQVHGQAPRRLTHLEFRLLYSLMSHPRQTLPTEIIVERVWGYSGQGDRELVRGLVSRLRAKIESEPRSPRYIRTVPGVGYSFDPEDG